MPAYDVFVTIEAATIQDALNRVMYPDGEPTKGIIDISAYPESS